MANDEWLSGESGSRRVIRDRLGHILEEMWAQDDLGGVILSSGDYYALDGPEQELYEVVRFDLSDYGVLTDWYEVSLEIKNQEAQRVDLRYTAMGADLTIPISLEVTHP